jgi:DNA-binding transcriptional LysR family regulator
MNYTLSQLQIFLKVVQTGSVTKASEELHLTQPAVSIQLKNLQDQFDIPLTEVIGRKIHITDFGYEIADAIEGILEQVHAINYKTMAYKGKLTGRLRISVVSTGKYVMPYFLADFLKEHEGIELQMDVTNKSAVIDSLEKNQVDFALVSILPTALHVESIELLENRLFLVGKSSPFLEENLSAEQIFSNWPMIFREPGSGTRQTMEEFIKASNISILKKMSLTSNEAVKQAVLAGIGFSIMPLIGIRNEIRNNELKIIKVDGLPITTSWRLIWLKGKRHSPMAKALLHHIDAEKERIVEKGFSWCKNY